VIRILNIVLVSLIATASLAAGASAGPEPKQMTLYKTPECGYCEGHADYLR
jgi:hypothetical protein